jgi:hypothetical protein
MTTADAFEYVNQAPVEIIRNGRYWLPDETGKHKAWTRATTIAKTLDDMYRITQADRRKVAIGIARTPSLAAAVNADHDDNKQLDGLCETAIANAGGVEGRDLGTALHRLIERVDLGELDYDGEWSPHLDVYYAALAAHRLTLRKEWIETVLVNVPYGIAGKVDRIVEDPEGLLTIADLKTGRYTSWLSWAIQFACYATSTHFYNPAADRLELLPPIRQDHTLAIHLPAGETPPHCQIHALSVPLGLDGLLMALEVRRMRAADKLPRLQATTYHHPDILNEMIRSIEEAFDPVAIRANLQARIDNLKELNVDAARTLLRVWPDGVPFLKRSEDHTRQQLTAIDHTLTRVEADYGIPF